MLGIFSLVFAFIILYILSRIFIRKLLTVLYRFLGREKASLVLGLIFLPGTFIHEISHFMMALFLLVPIGQLNLMPEITDEGIRLGSVSIGKTDFVRGSLVGLAPLIVGSGIVLWAISFVLSNGTFAKWWMFAVLIYLIFQLTHTMFSSKTDLKAVVELIIFLIIISIVLVILKIPGPFLFVFQKFEENGEFLLKLSEFLLIPIGLEILFLSLFRKVV